MFKKFQRKLAYFVAAIMIISGLSPATLNVNAASSSAAADGGYIATYSLSELNAAALWNASVTPTDDYFTVAFEGQYNQVFYEIPAAVQAAGLTKVSVNFAAGGNADALCLKLNTEVSGDGAASVAVDYWKSELAMPEGATASHLVFMSTLEEPSNYTISSVSFHTVSEVEGLGGGTTTAPVSTTVNAADLNIAAQWDASYENNTVNFNQQYAQVFVAIPEEIQAAGLQKVIVNFAEGSNADNLGLKLNTEVSGDGSATVAVDYWKSELSMPEGATASYLVFMALNADPSTYGIASITYQTTQQVSGGNNNTPSGPVSTTVAPADLSIAESWGGSIADNTIAFNGQYSQVFVTIPAEIKAAGLQRVAVDFAEGTAPYYFCIKLNSIISGDGDASVAVNYGEAALDMPEGASADYVVFMTTADSAYSYNINSVTFITATAPGSGNNNNNTPSTPTKPTWTVTDTSMECNGGMRYYNRWSSGQTSGDTITFNGQYQEMVLDLPAEVNLSKVHSITFDVEDQGGQICFKTLDAGLSEIEHDYNVVGSTSYTFVPTVAGSCTAISFMSMEPENYPYSVTIKKVHIEMDADATAPENGFVINGSDIALYNRHDASDVSNNSVTFGALWNEYCIDLPYAIDTDDIDKIAIEVSNQGGPVTVKLLDETLQNEIQCFWSNKGKDKYTFRPTGTGDVKVISVMAHDENADNYPFGITIDKVTITLLPGSDSGVEKGVEYELTDLRDKVTAVMGKDFIFGTAISTQEFADAMEMELVTKHFNAVTLGNEMKPDSFLRANAEKETITFNGQSLTVPVLNFSNAERMLDFIYDWNQAHPDDFIKVRGHVLVWHSQMPEFFFHENYDNSQALVTPAEMNLRLEWYIKSVAEHFTGADSKYKGMFYGWDVVNEAVSDSTGTYRNASENSKWWALYQSPEFITNAFVYANKYFPADVELYYNDYNDCSAGKSKAIATLLTAVKETPGARIDAMGMQGHYQISQNPTKADFKAAATLYASIVGKVQITELDFNGATSAADERLVQRYTDIYDAVRELTAEGVKVGGITIWGVIDKHSWLQTANSAGGGSNGSARQFPLLFSSKYKAKDCFYVFYNVAPTPAPTPVVTPAAPAPAPAPEMVTVPDTYTVVKGDCLSTIARKFNMSLAELLALNPQITNPNMIRIGQVINVGTKEVPADQAQKENTTETLIYVVKRGDSLYKIARRNRITLQKLLALNPQIRRPDLIFPGQKINLPQN